MAGRAVRGPGAPEVWDGTCGVGSLGHPLMFGFGGRWRDDEGFGESESRESRLLLVGSGTKAKV